MNTKLKRALAGVAAVAVSGLVPLITAAPASAAVPAGSINPGGTATVKAAGGSPDLNSGTSDTTFTLRLPSGAACTADGSAAQPGSWHTFFIPDSDPIADLAFSGGEVVGESVGSGGTGTFRQNHVNTGGSDVNNGIPQPGDAQIINIPNMRNNIYAPGEVPSGVYKWGIACTTTDGSGAMTTQKLWYKTVTVTYTPGSADASDFSWQVGSAPGAPTINSTTPGNEQCTVAFTPNGGDPAPTFTATATGTGGPFTANGSGSPLTITGLTNNETYGITVTADNGVGSPATSSSSSCAPSASSRTNVTNVDVEPGSPGSGAATVTWDPPAANTPAATPTGCEVVVDGPTASTQTVDCTTGTPVGLTGLNAGNYTLTVTAKYSDSPTSGSPVTPVAFQVFGSGLPGAVQQNVTVNRPSGGLVLTQVCGARGSAPVVDAGAYTGFPDALPSDAGQNSSTVNSPTAGGTTPTLTAGGTDKDPNRESTGVTPPGEYPYPTDSNGLIDASYPTHCALDLGKAKFVTRGAGAGQYFAASGFMNQVTVVDTRDDTPTFTVTGTMSDFSANADDSFDGSQLGWIPKVSETTGPFTDSDGTVYDQVVNAGGSVAPGVAHDSGLGAGRTLATAPIGACTTVGAGTPTEHQECTGSLGTAILDARLLLLIPITADAGNYTGTLTITAA